MRETSAMFDQMILPGFGSATSSPASGDGPTPSASPAGRTTVTSGPEAVRVSRFRALDAGVAMPTSDTSGPLFTASSPSAALQSSLASRLRQQMAGSGSPLYELTWSDVDMPSGPPICRLRASARRTSASACSGWPTAQARDWKSSAPARQASNARPLNEVARLAGWPMPDASAANISDANWEERRAKAKEKHGNNGFGLTLGMAVQLAGWETPKVSNSKSARAMTPCSMGGQSSPPGLEQQALIACGQIPQEVLRSGASDGWPEWNGPVRITADGAVLTGSGAETVDGGQLNPAFSAWLMGYSEAWCMAALSCQLPSRSRGRRSAG